MSMFKQYLRSIIKDGAQPNLDEHDIPYCSMDSCQKYDGKRCELMGARPHHFCEPALIDIMAKMQDLLLDG